MGKVPFSFGICKEHKESHPMNRVSSHPYITSYTFRSICQQALMFHNDTKYVRALGNGIVPDNVKEGDKI